MYCTLIGVTESFYIKVKDMGNSFTSKNSSLVPLNKVVNAETGTGNRPTDPY